MQKVLGFVDNLDCMFVLLHIIWLQQWFWSTNRIVAAQWSQPTLCGLRMVFVAIIVGTAIVGTVFLGIIVIFFFQVGIGLVHSSGSLRSRGVEQLGLADPLFVVGGVRLSSPRMVDPWRFVLAGLRPSLPRIVDP